MHPSVDPEIIDAAARVLKDDPHLSGAALLQRLVADIGPRVARQVPITRVEGLVRRPALRVVRTGVSHAEAERRKRPTVASHTNGRGKASEGDEQEPPSRIRDRVKAQPRVPTAVAQEVDEALLEAFSLGASCQNRSDVVAGFRRLDDVRRRLQKQLRRTA